MDKLWAPWRSKYILHTEEQGCIFCDKSQEHKDKKNYILKRGKFCFVMMNIYPYNNGHLMIAPYRHIGEIQKLHNEEISEMGKFVQNSVDILKKTMHPDGFNIGMNLGRVAGAGFEFHLHIHIVPRWNGDTNFMPVIADTKIVPISLDEAYKILKEKFK